MADEKRQIILDLLARAKTKKGTDEAASDLDKLGDAADRADKSTEKLGKTSSKTEKETEKLGKTASESRSRVASLDKEIGTINHELETLAASFADANNAADRLDISKAIRRTENDLRRVTKSKSILEGLLPDPEPEVRSWSKKLTTAIGSSLEGLASSPPLAIAGAAIGTAMAPSIGGAIAAAVVGGAGAGGIIGGVALAVQSSADIQGYASRIGKDFVDRLQGEARDAFGGPIISSLGKFEALADRASIRIGEMFDKLAPVTGPFVNNLIDAAEVLGESFTGAAEKSGPVIQALGKFFLNTADSLATFVNVMANHSDEAASSIDDLNDALGRIITITTSVVDALASIKGGLDSLDEGIDSTRYWLEDHIGWLDLTADGYEKGSEAAELYRKGIIGAADSASNYDHYLQGAIQSTGNLRSVHIQAADAAEVQKQAEQELTAELKAQTDPAFALLNAIDGVKDAQKAAAEATKKYGTNSEEARAATRKLAEAAISLQSAAGNAGIGLDGKLSPALRNTLTAAKLTKSQMRAVEEELKRAKRAADNYAREYKATITTLYVTAYQQKGAGKSRYPNERASGGPVVRDVPYLVGENGPEIIVPEGSGRVLSTAASRGLMAQAGSRGPGQTSTNATGYWTRPLQATVRVVGGADQGVASLINYLIRTDKIQIEVAA